MEQRQDRRTAWQEEREKRQREIMSISDRETRIKVIAKNIDLFTNKKAR